MTPPRTTREMLGSLAGTVCPFCGGTKKPHQSLCGHDYHALPEQIKEDLYRRFGTGYEQALWRALDFLEAKRRQRQKPTPGLCQ